MAGGPRHHGRVRDDRALGDQPARTRIPQAACRSAVPFERGETARHSAGLPQGIQHTHSKKGETGADPGVVRLRLEVEEGLVARPCIQKAPAGAAEEAAAQGAAQAAQAGAPSASPPPVPGGAGASGPPRTCLARRGAATTHVTVQVRNAPHEGTCRMREAELRCHSAKLLLRRLHRKIYVARSPEGERVLVKENANILEARREMRVMKAYGRAEHLVELLGYEERDGKAFIVMEWVPGKTLNNLIRKHGKLPVDRVLAIAAQILQGVDVLHRLGYVHGDLHGGNVMVTSLKDPRVKLIDMQMAADKGRTGRAKARRRVVSPPAHLAPESGGT